MAISKIQFKASAQATPVVWMDVTQDTVAAAHLETDYTAHDASGTQITGTLVPGGGPSYTWETVWSGVVSCTGEWGDSTYADYPQLSEQIPENSVWRVTWDGDVYECEATWAGSPDGNPYAIGNYTYETGGSGGTEFPFFVQGYWETNWAIVGSYGDHTVKFEKQVESSGGGLEYETGTYTPVNDIADPTISFTKTHTDRPSMIMMVDVGSTISSENSMLTWIIGNWYDAYGTDFSHEPSNSLARVQYTSRSSTSISNSTNSINAYSTSSSGSAYLNYYLTNTWFKPFGNSSRYWRAGRTYKWIAVWKPTT